MIPVFNSVDILEEVIEHALSQGIEPVVLDNGSTDGSYEVCEEFAKKNLIKLNRYATSKFDYALLSRILYDMALELKPDWLIRQDQDELPETGLDNVTLKEFIKNEDAKGFNLIQFDLFEFFMTDNDNELEKSIKKKFKYYSWQHDFTYRAWKHIPGTRVEDTLGHLPIFPELDRYKITQKKCVLRHYRFRDKNQALENVKQRSDRIKLRPGSKIGMLSHFKKISEQNFSEKTDHLILNQYLEDNNWNYESKFRPFVMDQPKRENIFSETGELLNHYPTIFELKAELKEMGKELKKAKDQLHSKGDDPTTY